MHSYRTLALFFGSLMFGEPLKSLKYLSVTLTELSPRFSSTSASTSCAVSTHAEGIIHQRAVEAREQKVGGQEMVFKKIRSMKRRLDDRATGDVNAQLQKIFTDLQASTSSIGSQYKTLAKGATKANHATTATAMSTQQAALQTALNTAISGVTKLIGQLNGDIDLNNLAGTIVNIINDLYPALATVEAGLAQDPALAPLVNGLAASLNGPLIFLVSGTESLLVGLLPIVNGLINGLGLGPVIAGVGATVGGLLTGLGLPKIL
ncbi:hypothetical protein P7C70_g7211, partial [Phenoliferia sp. Uapishka_3]